MKKNLSIALTVCCLLIIASVSTSFAEVTLVWDMHPTEQAVDMYQVEMDGRIVADVPPGTFHILITLPDGNHTARVRAHNVWGWSEFSDPFLFVKGVPAIAAGIRLKVVP